VRVRVRVRVRMGMRVRVRGQKEETVNVSHCQTSFSVAAHRPGTTYPS
jgi:hypothetical protein